MQEIEIASNANFFSDRLHGDSLLDFDALHEHLKDLQENVHLFQNLSMSGVTGRDESFKLRLLKKFVYKKYFGFVGTFLTI